MNRSRLVATSLALLALVSSQGASVAAAAAMPPERDYGSGSIHRAFEWQEVSGVGRAAGLHIVDMVPAGMIQRVLVKDPAGRQVRITTSFDPRRGVETCELLDDATGWRAHLKLDNGLRADTLGAFFAADEARSAARRLALYRLGFTADGTRPIEVEIEIELAEREALYAAVTEAVLTADAGPEFVAQMPEGLAEAILFLDASMSPEPLQTHTEGDNLAYGLRGIVEVVADVVRAVPPEGLEADRYATPWPMTVAPMKLGTSSSDPEVLEFVSRFRSVENADPLSDRRAAEVFAVSLPPN